MYSFAQILPLGLAFAGFVAGSVIAERSLKGVDDAIQGRLLRELAPVRKVQFLGIIGLIIALVAVPNVAWAAITMYVLLFPAFAVFRISKLDLPRACRQGQVASVVLVFSGLAAAALLWHFNG